MKVADDGCLPKSAVSWSVEGSPAMAAVEHATHILSDASVVE